MKHLHLLRWYIKKQIRRMVDASIYDFNESRERLKRQEDDPMLAVWIRCAACGKYYENYRAVCSSCGRKYD